MRTTDQHFVWRTLSCQILFTTLVFASSALATTAIERSFPELVQRADVVVVGTVNDIHEQWDTERQVPFTLVTLSNLTVLKGNPGSELTLYFLGGHTPNGKILSVAETPHFTVGEKTVVFSAGNQRDVIPLVGLWQGLLRVQIDTISGTEFVTDHAGVPLRGIENGKWVTDDKVARTEGAAQPAPLSLSTLQQMIQQELGGTYESR